MKGRYPLTKVRLHRALLDLLAHPEVHLTYTPLKLGGKTVWDDVMPPTNIRIKVDANGGDDLAVVIHELLHIIFYPLFVGRTDSTLEEVCIVGLEQYMFTYVTKSHERTARWRKLIKKKLDEHLVDVPLEEQVDRRKEDARDKKRGG